MIIGVPREIEDSESRVAVVPAGVDALIGAGHEVLVERGAGLGSGISDAAFTEAGARCVPSHEEVFEATELVLKVRKPFAVEQAFCRPGQMLLAFFHFAANRELTLGMMETGSVCIACETIEDAEGRLPLLAPMSEVAGRMAVHAGAKYLETSMMGRGILLGGIPGVDPAEVVVIGGGVVGVTAARTAARLGAHVTVLEVSPDRLRHLSGILPSDVETLPSDPDSIARACEKADLVIGAVLRTGAKAPILVTREMLGAMKPGSVIIDVSVDQGGCVETTRPTTHSNPTFIEERVVHYGVANMPGAVGRTSTTGLTSATLPIVLRLADAGWQAAGRSDPGVAAGLNVVDGRVACRAVAEALDLPFTPIEDLL